MVVTDTIGNITRPPNRSVRAPTGTRPSEPTTTGTATSKDCWNELRSRPSLNRGPSGLSSAHAQKFTAKPTVASASISHARPGTGAPDGELPPFDFNCWTMFSVPFLFTEVRPPRDPTPAAGPLPAERRAVTTVRITARHGDGPSVPAGGRRVPGP